MLQATGQLRGNAPMEQLSISSVTRDIEACNHRFATYIEKLQQLDAKIQGQYPTPPAALADKIAPVADSLISGLNMTRNAYSALLDEFERLLGALEAHL